MTGLASHTLRSGFLACVAFAAWSAPAAAQNFDFTCSINSDGLLVDAMGLPVDATVPCFPAELEGLIGTMGPNGLPLTSDGGSTGSTGVVSNGSGTTDDGTPNSVGGDGVTPSGVVVGDGSTVGGGDSADDGTGSSDPSVPSDPGDAEATPPVPDPTPIPAPVIFAGALNGGSDAVSVLRLANFGEAAGTAHVTAVDPASGEVLAWADFDLDLYSATQASIPATFGSIAPTGKPMPAVIDLQISADFPGTVQHLIGNPADGLLTNASSCGARVSTLDDRIAYIPPDAGDVRSWVRIVNSGDVEAYADVIVRHAATGEPITIWISDPVSPGGSITVPAAAVRAQVAADAGLDPVTDIAAIMIDPATFPENMRLELVATNGLTGAVADQTTVCAF